MSDQKKKTKKKIKPTYLIILAVVIVAAGAFWVKSLLSAPEEVDMTLATAPVDRRDLTISVVESGEIEARYTTDITCKVEGRGITIIDLIPEGTVLTEQDIADGTILVELDSSDLAEQYIQREMSYNSAQNNYIASQQSYEIQKSQNESNINAAELRERFALMDLEKFLTKPLAHKLLEANNEDGDSLANLNLDISILEADPDALGGGIQRLNDLRNSIDNAKEQRSRNESVYKGSQKLAEKNYVSQIDLEADESAFNRSVRTLESTQADLQLFMDYDFRKEAEQLFSNYQEAKRQTQRTILQAHAQLTQKDTSLNVAQLILGKQKEDRERVKRSLDACIIRAPVTGMVVYGREHSGRGMSQGNLVELGGEVRNRQKLFSIPSTNDMAVKVKVHETWIDKVEPNQVCLITLDAYPDRTFTGTVYDVALLASSAERWMSSSDLKVYETMVSIDGSQDAVRDGMNAKVEIIIEQLKDVVCIPVQAVANVGDKKVCYVVKEDGSLEERQVQVGSFNNNFIEIKEGLAEGEQVSLIPKRQVESTGQIEQRKQEIIERALESRGGGGPEGMRGMGGRDRGGDRTGPEGMRDRGRGRGGEEMTPEQIKQMMQRGRRGDRGSGRGGDRQGSQDRTIPPDKTDGGGSVET